MLGFFVFVVFRVLGGSFLGLGFFVLCVLWFLGGLLWLGSRARMFLGWGFGLWFASSIALGVCRCFLCLGSGLGCTLHMFLHL